MARKQNDDNEIIPPPSPSAFSPSSYRVAKWCMLRMIGFVYFFVFLGAYHQNAGLFNSNGLSPVAPIMDRLRSDISLHAPPGGNGNELDNPSLQTLFHAFLQYPTIFWMVPLNDWNLSLVTNLGLILSALVMIGLHSWLAMSLLWLFHFSIVTLAERSSSFYSYGWESQLLETGFLAIFLCDLPHLVKQNVIQESTTSHQQNHNPKDDNDENYKSKTLIDSRTEIVTKWRIHGLFRDESTTTCSQHPSMVAIYLMNWLMFRISIGAGLIKIRGSSCWTQKTCLWYHFETQPIPSPLSFVFHFLPKWMLSRAVDLDLFVQIYFVWLVLIPPGIAGNGYVATLMNSLRRVGGLVQLAFMVNIMLSGNFSILNHLTIVPALASWDDACMFWPSWLTFRILNIQNPIKPKSEKVTGKPMRRNTSCILHLKCTRYTRHVLDGVLLITIGILSIPVVSNLLQLGGKHQQMNASFHSLRLVNTYGAFGSVGEARYEPIISISYDTTNDETTTWHEIDLPCKPGKLTRRPCFCAPYHYRLDWNIWFIGFKPHISMLQQRESWLFSLLVKMLERKERLDETNAFTKQQQQQQRPWLTLLDSTAARYFPPLHSKQPQMVKVDMYHYTMAQPLWDIVRRIYVNRENRIVWWKRNFEQSLIPPVKLNQRTKQLLLVN